MTTWVVTAGANAAPILDALPADETVRLVLVEREEAKKTDYCCRLARFSRASTTHVVLPVNAPEEAAGPVVVATVRAGRSDTVLLPDTHVERAFAGALAAALRFPLVADVREVRQGELVSGRFSGHAVQRVAAHGVVGMVSGAMAAAWETGAAAPAAPAKAAGAEAGCPADDARVSRDEPVPAELYAARVTAAAPSDGPRVDLTHARRVVAVGRGVRTAADLALVQDLADALGAQIGATRPMVEGDTALSGGMALPRECYIGLSGAVIAPDLYVAVGISGQAYHLDGVMDARLIVAINSDPEAPIFSRCDYGIVGDLREVVPRLTAAIRARQA
ncbi:electron transfer flavoprotein subunit alpha/FixB family protein [Neoactinobaculum massilliense]|uniref:electron transfer flavoprotein subunit alpha/FixB family protein n=1 Tax=Neoactinobaculum massilliense TaxID=2364794 RepID=UPI000F529A23|nr:electron transfer flavoprotein subunit alpha/FixB family protein [Neoactinobaculum massilliense]